MKKLVFISSAIALLSFSGCTTKYLSKCDGNSCEKRLETNSVKVASTLMQTQKDCCDKSVKTCEIKVVPQKVVVKPKKTIKVKITLKDKKPSQDCQLDDLAPIAPYMDNY